MPNVPITPPPGVFKAGTDYQSKGRWLDTQLVRFIDGTKQAAGGWENIQKDDPPVNITFSAIAVLTMTGNFLNGETAVIDGKTYTFEDSLTNVDGNVHIGADENETLEHLVAAITLGAGAGTDYAAATTEHATVTAYVGPGSSMVAEAKATGLAGVGLAVSETLNNGSWDESTLVGNVCRTLLGWREKTNDQAILALGTNRRIYTMSGSFVTDRTPADITAGSHESDITTGQYGVGRYGVGAYGIGDELQSALDPLDLWQLDAFGDFLVGVLSSDGRMLFWDPNGAGDELTEMTNSPTARGIVVTPEHFVVALGADGNPRKLQWPDVASLTDWTPAEDNEAGDHVVQGTGVLMAGERGRNETLIWTDADLHAMQYVGGSIVYKVDKLGDGCGLIAPNAKAVLGGRAAWMGRRGFWVYDGYVRSVPSEVNDFVFSDININQRHKFFAVPVNDMREVWFFYCSGTSEDPDRYVIWNYQEDHWTPGTLARTAGIDRRAFDFPIMASLDDLFYHERGFVHSGAAAPFLESGPVELGAGDSVMDIEALIPDEKTQNGQQLGAMELTLITKDYPDDTETEHGPFTLTSKTDLRLNARTVRVRLTEIASGDWRVGDIRLEVKPSGER